MRARVKAGVMLFATFVLGGIVGALGAGTVAQRRLGPPPPPREGGPPMGFVELVEDILQPHDSVQRATVRPLLEATDRRNRAIVDDARVSMHASLDSLRASLATILDPEQLEAFDEMVRRQGRDRRGPLGLEGRGPPPLEGGPPPR
jgi:hypothetical protein